MEFKLLPQIERLHLVCVTGLNLLHSNCLLSVLHFMSDTVNEQAARLLFLNRLDVHKIGQPIGSLLFKPREGAQIDLYRLALKVGQERVHYKVLEQANTDVLAFVSEYSFYLAEVLRDFFLSLLSSITAECVEGCLIEHGVN